MPSRVYAGSSVDVDQDGYFVQPKAWTPAMGDAIAKELGITMTEIHWRLINFARSDFAKRGESPGMRRLEAETKIPIKQIYQLFPKGPGKLVAKVAGIPKPKSCL